MTIADLVDSWRGRKYRIFKTDIRGSSVSGVGEVNSGEVLFFSLSLLRPALFPHTSASTVDGAGPFGPIPLKESLPSNFP